MRRISLFAEDFGHEEVLTGLVQRYARNFSIDVEVVPLSVRGGHGKVLTELAEYVRDLEAGRLHVPDLLIVATDANCAGYNARKTEIDGAVTRYNRRDLNGLVECLPVHCYYSFRVTPTERLTFAAAPAGPDRFDTVRLRAPPTCHGHRVPRGGSTPF